MMAELQSAPAGVQRGDAYVLHDDYWTRPYAPDHWNRDQNR